MSRFLQHVSSIIKECVAGGRFPPFSPALALVQQSTTSTSSSPTITDIVRDMQILWGVPKTRTTWPVKMTRKHSYTRILSPVTNVVTCPDCGSKHVADTICGDCYQQVRQLTNAIKEKMMQYNPYKHERQDKEVFVRFEEDKDIDPSVVNGKRVIEIQRPRPSWFKQLKPRE